MLKVELLAHTPEPDRVAAAAYKICYSSDDAEGIFGGLTPEGAAAFLEKMAGYGHESPVEHVSFTFAIEGVSRALMAQLTRHRIASFSVQSQRYVKESGFAYVTPPEIAQNPEALAAFEAAMAQSQAAYDRIGAILAQSHRAALEAGGVEPGEARARAAKLANEDARFVLPNACETKLIATFNVRSLYNLFKIRCCNRAQWEIRALAWRMLALCLKVSPVLFGRAGPGCLGGRCTEGGMGCGQAEAVRRHHQSIMQSLKEN